MKRRNFIATSILAGTATALNAQNNNSLKMNEGTKPFIVKAGKSRFENYNPGGVLKVSSKDSGKFT